MLLGCGLEACGLKRYVSYAVRRLCGNLVVDRTRLASQVFAGSGKDIGMARVLVGKASCIFLTVDGTRLFLGTGLM